jgi:hypothetical protein
MQNIWQKEILGHGDERNHSPWYRYGDDFDKLKEQQ